MGWPDMAAVGLPLGMAGCGGGLPFEMGEYGSGVGGCAFGMAGCGGVARGGCGGLERRGVAPSGWGWRRRCALRLFLSATGLNMM